MIGPNAFDLLGERFAHAQARFVDREIVDDRVAVDGVAQGHPDVHVVEGAVRLHHVEERELAEEGFGHEGVEWPAY